MKVVIQRVLEAKVEIVDRPTKGISSGLVILLGISANDRVEDLSYIVKKVVNLRIFSDESGKMNCSLVDVAGDVLLISQFTLFANSKKGHRPSYTSAARPDIALPLYRQTIEAFESNLAKPIQTGEFGADMRVSLVNDGPVTIVIDSQNK